METHNSMVRKLRLTSISIAFLTIFLGALVITGWYTHIEEILSVIPGMVAMQYNTALGFFLSGIAFLMTIQAKNRAAFSVALLVFVLGFLTAVEYIFGLNFGIDELFMEHYITDLVTYPGRMAPNTATCFTLSGITLMVFNWQSEKHSKYLIGGTLGVLIFSLGTVAFTGYLSGVTSAYGWSNLTAMAVHTALGFMLLGLGMFFYAWKRDLKKRGSMYPEWIAYPFALGLLSFSVSMWQAINFAEGKHQVLINILVLFYTVVVSLLLALAVRLSQRTQKKNVALKELNLTLNETQERYAYAIEASKDGIIDYDVKTNTAKFSPSVYLILGYQPYEFEENMKAFYNHLNDSESLKSHLNIFLGGDLSLENDRFSDEFKMKTKLGEIIWIALNGKVVEFSNEGKSVRIVGTITDITSEKKKNQEMLEAVIQTEDNERRRISKEIHDGLQQKMIISSLNIKTGMKALNLEDGEIKDKLDNGWNYLQEAMIESRAVAHALMPKAIVDFGIISACDSLVETLNSSSHEINFTFLHNFEELKIEHQQIEIVLYRILQESTNNILKYSKATKVDIQLKDYDDIYLMTIEDNGVGFDRSKINDPNKSFGIQGMRNRVEAIDGIFEIESTPGRGTTVIVEINKQL